MAIGARRGSAAMVKILFKFNRPRDHRLATTS
jgi:hypothetical protein